MLCLILIVGGLLIMMGQHDRSEALFYYFRMEDQVPDPRQDNLTVKLVELRHQLKERNPNLARGLKVAANSAAFGIFCQMDVKDLDSPSRLHVFSGAASYKILSRELGLPHVPPKWLKQPAAKDLLSHLEQRRHLRSLPVAQGQGRLNRQRPNVERCEQPFMVGRMAQSWG